MTHEPHRSSIRAEDWLPVQEQLLRGLNHSLSNRLASLGAISMLMEGASDVDDRLRGILSEDVERINGLLGSYRALVSSMDGRREPVRLADMVSRAQSLLVHHADAGDCTFTPVSEAADVEPVALVSHDGLRASALLILAVLGAAPTARAIDLSLSGGEGWVHVVARCTTADEARVQGGPAFAALGHFAACEGGRVETAKSDAGGASVTLTLPALSRVRAAKD